MGNKTTTTAKADPWKPVQAPLEGAIGDATDLYASGGFKVNPYQGDWVAGTTDATKQGREGLLSAISGGQFNIGDVVDRARGFASGSTAIDRNALQQNVLESIMPSINATFAGSGMTGSSLHQANLAKGLASGMAGVEGQIAGHNLADKSQRMSANAAIPGLVNAQAAPYETMINIGNAQQAQTQAEIDAAMRKDMLTQSSDALALKDYLAMLSGVGGQFSTQTNTEQQKLGPLGIIGGILQAGSFL